MMWCEVTSSEVNASVPVETGLFLSIYFPLLPIEFYLFKIISVTNFMNYLIDVSQLFLIDLHEFFFYKIFYQVYLFTYL